MYAFAGCTGMSKDLQKETARAIGEPLDTIDVTHMDRVAASIKWEAVTAKGNYSCSADSELRDTRCIKR